MRYRLHDGNSAEKSAMLANELSKIAAAFDRGKEIAKQQANLIGPRLTFEQASAIRAKKAAAEHAAWQARTQAIWEASAPQRDAHDAYLEKLRNGTSYERAVYDEYILNMKDCWTADDYAESDSILARKKTAAADLSVSA